MTIGIIGGTGFLGKQLTLHLLGQTDWYIRVISHRQRSFAVPQQHAGRVEFVSGDVLDEASIAGALRDVDTAYYFVHMMGQQHGDFYAQELRAAETFKRAIQRSSLKRLVYMGGLGSDDDKLSAHLASRHRTGRILRSLGTEVIELQASMIIGRGSVAFDIIANLVDRLPVMLLPGKAATLTQPIALPDALAYLRLAATVRLQANEVVQIGGPDVLSYADIYRLYAAAVRKRRLVLRVPLLPAWLEARFLDIFTPRVHARIGKAMVESLGNEMVVTSGRSRELFPEVVPRPVAGLLAELAVKRP